MTVHPSLGVRSYLPCLVIAPSAGSGTQSGGGVCTVACERRASTRRVAALALGVTGVNMAGDTGRADEVSRGAFTGGVRRFGNSLGYSVRSSAWRASMNRRAILNHQQGANDGPNAPAISEKDP
jgi:hypothetical protein